MPRRTRANAIDDVYHPQQINHGKVELTILLAYIGKGSSGSVILYLYKIIIKSYFMRQIFPLAIQFVIRPDINKNKNDMKQIM